MRRYIVAQIVLLAWTCRTAAQTSSKRYIFLFGDSYSSTNFNSTQELPSQSNPLGNPPFPGITSANGSNWIDDLVYYNESQPHPLCYNYAFPGALVTRLPTDKPPNEYRAFEDQVPLFEDNVKDLQWGPSNSIMISWFGINDSGLNVAFGLGPSNPKQVFAQIAATYFNQLDTFYRKGGRAFMMFNVPPIWRTPIAITKDSSAAVQKSVGMFNLALARHAADFQVSHAEAKISIFDPSPIFHDILDNYFQYGAPDATCTNDDGAKSDCLWNNAEHPAPIFHKALATAIHQQLEGLGFYRNEFNASVPKPPNSSATRNNAFSASAWACLALITSTFVSVW